MRLFFRASIENLFTVLRAMTGPLVGRLREFELGTLDGCSLLTSSRHKLYQRREQPGRVAVMRTRPRARH